MSRMTKFLKQTCKVEAYKLDESGNPAQNRFGEIEYEEPVVCKCRREQVVKDVQTQNGSLVRSTARYFLDEKFELKADYRIDGHVLLIVEEYTNERGLCEGYEVYV